MLSLFRKKPFIFLVILIVLVIQNSFGYSQGLKSHISAQEIFDQIEKRDGVTIIYKDSWFVGKEFDSNILNLSQKAAIEKILKNTDLSIIYIDDYLVFVPSEGLVETDTPQEGDVIIVGNPHELGKYSKVRVEGYVFDGATREPLIGAIVYEEETGQGVSTDLEGRYSLSLSTGETKLKISYLGYEDTYEKLRIYSPGDVDFDIFERSLQLEGATITAFRKDANIRNTQMSTIRLDPITLKEIPGALGERDIIKSFTLLPGIQSMGEFGTGFNVRGGDSDQNLILLEDMPIFNSSHLFGLVSIVNPDMVTGVTLIKAGMPAKYGERASSIVDIRKRGGNPDETKFRGGLGLLYSRMHMETPLFNKNASLSLGGRSSYSNWLLSKIPDKDLMNSSANFYDLSGVFSLNIGSKHSLSIFGYQSQDDFLMGGETDHTYKSQIGSVRLNSSLTPKITSRLTLGISRYSNLVEQPVEVSPRSAFAMRNSVDYGTVKWNFDIDPNEGKSYSLGLQAVTYNINPGDIQPIGEESYVVGLNLNNEKAIETAAYASGNFELTPMLNAEIGVRGVWYNLVGPAKVYEYDTNLPRLPENIIDTTFFNKDWETVWSDFGIEPRLGLRLLLNDNNSLKLSYNRNHQYVGLLSNTAVMSPTDVWRLSNEHTGALKAHQVALGYYKLLPDMDVEFNVESYFKLLRNIVEYRDGASILMNPHVETELVGAKGYGYGVEFYLTKKEGDFTGWISYTWSRSFRKTTEEHEIMQVNGNDYFPSSFDKPHSLILNSTYRMTRRWRVNATFTYNTGRPVTFPEQVFNYQGHQPVQYSDRNKYRLPDYHRLDLSISLDENLKLNAKWKGSWTLSILNVYGRKNAYSVFYKKDKPTEENNFREYSLYKLYIIGRPLPTLTYNFIF